jgi:hypothetical protein
MFLKILTVEFRKVKIMKNLLLFLMLSLLGSAYAAGGLSAVESSLDGIKTAVYSIVGVCATLYLLFKGVQLWSDKIQWADFLTAVAAVAVVGASLVIASWAWSAFA